MTSWKLDEATRDAQSVTSDWTPIARAHLIDGVKVHESRNVLKGNGALVEIYRTDWKLESLPIEQVFQVLLHRRGLSAWHTHERTHDRLFVNLGSVRIVLFDARDDSPTKGLINEFIVGELRPTLVIVPPKVWHGVQNVGSGDALILNLVERAYSYEQPDHWRLPSNTAAIPYAWPT